MLPLCSSLTTLLVIFAWSHLSTAFLFITDRTLSHMVVFTTDQRSSSRMKAFVEPKRSCTVINDRRQIMRVVMSSGASGDGDANNIVRTASPDEMGTLMDACKLYNTSTGAGGASDGGGFIFPGTKWCGPGSAARSYEDLGRKAAEDRCCRDHDNCPSSIAAGQCKYGICNKTPFTRSDCKCDVQFQNCLKRVRTNTADTIGTLYFNLGRVMCFNDPARCKENPKGCRYSTMPFYKANPARGLRSLLSEVIRGIIKLKFILL